MATDLAPCVAFLVDDQHQQHRQPGTGKEPEGVAYRFTPCAGAGSIREGIGRREHGRDQCRPNRFAVKALLPASPGHQQDPHDQHAGADDAAVTGVVPQQQGT